jgi:hypothetical protein
MEGARRKYHQNKEGCNEAGKNLESCSHPDVMPETTSSKLMTLMVRTSFKVFLKDSKVFE